MHFGVTLFTIACSLKWANWAEWRKYHASMYFIATGGLLYEYMVRDYTLWKFHPDILYGHSMTVIVYALITMPVSVLIFLSQFPDTFMKRVLHILYWSFVYIAVEYILMKTGRISYQHGWEFIYSFYFDLMMFTIIAIHQFSPVKAYILSLGIVTFLLTYFDVPFKVL